MKEEYNVYVIGLKPEFAKTKAAKKQNPNFVPSKYSRCYYVGYSSKSPEERYEQHISGYVNEKGHKLYSRKVLKYGYKRNGLRRKRYKDFNPISSKSKAMKIEKELAEKLREDGHCVYQA